jgi:hypothetical protein
MGIWIRTFNTKPAGALKTEAAKTSIDERLALLTALLCPDDEEEPKAVLARLVCTANSDDKLTVAYWAAEKPKLVFERWKGDPARDEILEVVENLSDDEVLNPVRATLKKAIEVVGVRLTQSDLDGMGLPVAMAYFSKLASEYGGLIHVESRGWYQPIEKEVKLLAEE